MLRHVSALVVVALAGWVVLMDVLERCMPGWARECGERVEVAGWVVAGAVLAGAAAVAAVAPRRRAAVSLRTLPSAAITVAPAFLPVALVAAVALLSDTPREEGQEMLQRLRHELSARDAFPLREVMPVDASLFVVGRSDGRQLWVVRRGYETLAQASVPAHLGGCLGDDEYYATDLLTRCD